MKRYFYCILLAGLLTIPFSLFSQGNSVIISKAVHFINLLSEGKYTEATLNFDSRMQQALPAEKVKQVWQNLQAQAGSFKGQLSARSAERGNYRIIFVPCAFENANLDAKIIFNPNDQIAGLFFVPGKAAQTWQTPDYVQPNSFTEIDTLHLANEWALPATLTLPKGEGPFPAIILVHGSGPLDRDESIGPNKPFRDLAWGLASRGIAVLRYEKRTKFYAHKMDSLKDKITVMDETVDDALAAVTLLRKTPKIDPDKIIILGHSLGGTLIPRIASLYPRIAGFIIMAGATRPLEDLIVKQFKYIYELDGKMSPQEKTQWEAIKRKAANVKKLKPGSKMNPADLPFGAAPAYWLDLKNYNLPALAAKMNKPVLVMQGQRDYQVTLEDYNGWKKALAGKKKVTFKLYPDLNHLFISGKGKSSPIEYQQAGHINLEVIADIARWVKKNF